MKKKNVENIENISLSAKQIKAKLEDSLAYDHDKFKDIDILFAAKREQTSKLPFSDYKISISEEMYTQQLLLEDIKNHFVNVKMIEEKVEPEIAIEENIEIEDENEIIEDEIVDEDEEMHAFAPSTNEETNNINIVEEICEFDEIIEDEEDYDDENEDEDEDEIQYAQLPYSARAKRPKGYTIKVVDVDAVIRKIKAEGAAKNEGKPVIGRRQINKLLKPYIIKSNNDMDNIAGIDGTMTSIDIYLNAVDKIAHTGDGAKNKNSSNSLELNINDILEDLEK